MAENKYKAKRVTVDGIEFDSLKEAKRYGELKILQTKGYIQDLELQKKYVLIQKQIGKDGKVAERECAYYADFYYRFSDTLEEVVEDVKGYRKSKAYDVFVIKRKLMLKLFGIRVKER